MKESTHDPALVLLGELTAIAGEFEAGRAGRDFLVTSAEAGCGFHATPLERRLSEAGERLLSRLAEDPGLLTPPLLAGLIPAFSGISRGCDTLRTRLQAAGGDHAEVDSIGRDFLVRALDRLREALARLEARGDYPLDGLGEAVLAAPLVIRSSGAGSARPFVEFLFDPGMACFRRPALARLLKSRIREADEARAKAKKAARKLANYRRTIIDDGRDGLLDIPDGGER